MLDQPWSEKYQEEKFLQLPHDDQIEMLKQFENDRQALWGHISELRRKIDNISGGTILNKIFQRRQKSALTLQLGESLEKENILSQHYSKLWDLKLSPEKNNSKQEELPFPQKTTNDTQKIMNESSKKVPDENTIKPDTSSVKLGDIPASDHGEKEDMGLVPEDASVERCFSTDYLAQLSMEKYIALLQKFSGFMVTNVVRQGVRDHAEFYNHMEGLGEFDDSFEKILKSGALHSIGTASIEQNGDNPAMETLLHRYVHLDGITSLNEAKTALVNQVAENKQFLEDKMAVHFAIQEVADRRYGGEKNNEIFIAFPWPYMVSQCYLGGSPVDTKEGTSDSASDLWAWTKDSKGININTGAVFIPANQQVDQTTGSKYQLDQDRKPVVNEDYIGKLVELVDSSEYKVIAERAGDIINNLTYTFLSIKSSHLKNDRFDSIADKNTFLREKLADYRREFVDKFGISDIDLQDALFNANSPFHYVISHDAEQIYEGDTARAVKEWLLKKGFLFKKSRQTVSSKEYWTGYFANHPELKPSKIVFYEEATPNEAFTAWQTRNNLNLDSSLENRPGTPPPSDFFDKSLGRFEEMASMAIEKNFN